MDLSLIKQKLTASQNKGQKREKVDYSKIFWKPKVGKHQVRILPSVFNKQNPFREIYLHYGFAKFPILSLTNWQETDPINEFAKSLRKSSDPEDWQLAKKITPKLRYFAPVLVRGEEEMGARLWEFGKLTYEQLLGIAADEDYGDYTDITEGRDFTVDAIEDMVAGRKGIKCTLRVKPKTTPISDNAELVEKVLNEQPDILGINKHHSFDEIKEYLDRWLNPEEDGETPIASASGTGDVEDEKEEDDFIKEMNKPVEVEKPYQLKTKPAKVKPSDKFDDLFTEDPS